jgi:hypothetical protein
LSSEYPPPDRVLSDTDRGDDTQRRYRYQAAYAALISLDLLREDSEFEEIFCEHHEDILVRGKDKKFVGIQVKTRKLGGGAFTFSDLEITTSLIRFLKLEKKYPDHFKRYVIAANCGFWQKSQSDSNLVYCLDAIKENNATVLNNEGFLKRVEKLSKAAKCDGDFVMKVLKKVIPEESPSLGAYEPYLVNAMAEIPTLSGERIDVLNRAASSLIDVMTRAASLSHTSARSAYFAILEHPETAEKDEVIQGKRVTRAIVEQIINRARAHAGTLPKGTRSMELKMAKGGISIQNIDLARDLKFSAETLLIGWIHKYGSIEADERHQYLRVVVRNECQEAYDSVETDDNLFGEDMLGEIRKRLRNRYDYEVKSRYSDCVYEHLLGIAAILTEECKIWWSEVFDLPEEVTQ